MDLVGSIELLYKNVSVTFLFGCRCEGEGVMYLDYLCCEHGLWDVFNHGGGGVC